jgi:hypothetical protein
MILNQVSALDFIMLQAKYLIHHTSSHINRLHRTARINTQRDRSHRYRCIPTLQ